MNFLKSNDVGGFPFVLDDLRFEQAAVREAFFGLVTAWGGSVLVTEDYIITGCVFTPAGSAYNVSAGYVAMQGEIYKVDAHTTANVPFGQFLQFAVEETNDPAGLKTFFGGGSFNTYKIRRAKAVVVVSLTTTNALIMETIHDRIYQQTAARLGKWNYINLFGAGYDTGNVASDGLGAVATLAEGVKAGSYVLYNIIGDTIHINLKMIDLVTRRFDDNNLGSVLLDLGVIGRGFKSTYPQEGIYRATSTTQPKAFAGMHPVTARPNSSVLVFKMTNYVSSDVWMNRRFEMEAAPSKNITYSTETDEFITYTFSANLTFQLN